MAFPKKRLRVGRLVARARADAGLSIRKLAELSGVHPSNITKIENGRYNVSIDILAKVLAPLGMRIATEGA